MKEESTTELKDRLQEVRKEQKDLINKAKEEKRALSAEETQKIDQLDLERRELQMQIQEKEFENRSKGTVYVVDNPVKAESFSIRRVVNSLLGQEKLSKEDESILERSAKFHKESGLTIQQGGIILPSHENRATLVANGSTAVQTDVQPLLLPFQNNLVLASAGARIISGLKGNVRFPSISDVTVNWEGENATAKDGNVTLNAGREFKPKRLTCFVPISRQLIIQDSLETEMHIRSLMATAIAQKLEITAFGSHDHAENTPDGLYTGAKTPAIKGKMNWGSIVNLETSLDTINALNGSLSYVMHPKLVGLAKTTVKDKSGAGGFVMDANDTINSYKVHRTNAMATGLNTDEYGVIFGNFNDYFVGQWGGLELTLDPYTGAKDGLINIIISGYFDMGAIRDESFVKASMK